MYCSSGEQISAKDTKLGNSLCSFSDKPESLKAALRDTILIKPSLVKCSLLDIIRHASLNNRGSFSFSELTKEIHLK